MALAHPHPASDPAARRRRGAVVVAAAGLLALGLLLVLSGAETPAAGRWGRRPAEYLLRQAGAAALGFAVLLGCAGLGRRRLERLAAPLAALLAVASALTLVPGVGVTFGGARRHVEVGGVGFQPTVLFAAAVPLLLGVRLGGGASARRGAWALVAAVGGVCLLQPNFGHLGTVLATAMGALWGYGRAARAALVRVAGAFLLAGPLALCFPYVRWRVRSFLDPGLTRDTLALERIASESGPLGLGLGRGVDKGLLSAAPTDYLFALTLEELGWLGGGAALALLLLLCLSAWRLGTDPGAAGPDPLRRAVASGTAAFLAFPALVHVAVCLRWFPVTGIHLPLLSYSGSSVLAALLALGLLLGVAREERDEPRS